MSSVCLIKVSFELCTRSLTSAVGGVISHHFRNVVHHIVTSLSLWLALSVQLALVLEQEDGLALLLYVVSSVGAYWSGREQC